jgi:asparagine synthase (glutamine-hydrolysing)
MCGIAGYITVSPSPPQRAVLERMTDSLRHRGPDGSGFYQDDHASLGHRRLSIIDLAGGHQPMANEDASLSIVYNGEIFNHAELRPTLEAAGHRYATRCDTETILHAYEQDGPNCLERLRGMFAFAIWDRRARKLFAARDRLGKKPFYYYWDGRLLAFASEIKALFRHPSISPRFEEDLLAEYLAFGYISEERTLFSGIRKLMPGHWLLLDLSAPRPEPHLRQYWEIPTPVPTEKRSDNSWIRECRSRLEETVRLRLMSDVPVGMFLSGGLDSSAIAAIMKRQSSGPVKTFAVGYAERQFSELPYAAHVAHAIGTSHHEITIGMEEFFNALPRLIWHEDEPLAWPSSVSLYFVSRLASAQVKVVLTGEGSDEIFAGYARYRAYALNHRWQRFYRLLPSSWRRGIRSHVASSRLLHAGLRRKLRHTFLGRGEDLESLYLDNFYSALSAAEQSELFRCLPNRSPYENFRRYWDAHPGLPLLARMLNADQKTYLVELLMKQDQMSMGASIESRVPFLDHELVEFSTQVPGRLKLHRGQSKYILKKAVEDFLPPDIVYRRKMGFPTPIQQWLLDPRADVLYSILRARDGFLADYIDFPVLDRLLERHKSGFEDATDRIWRLLNLQIWGDLFFTGKYDERWDGLLAAARPAV